MTDTQSQSDINQIVAEAAKVQTDLEAQEARLEDEIDKIDNLESTAPLTDQQRLQRKQLRAAQTSCRAAMVELSNVTLTVLDNSPEVKRLINSFQSINKDLEGDLKQLGDLAQAANTVAQIVGALAQVAAKLATVA
jgi:hypothetical protein